MSALTTSTVLFLTTKAQEGCISYLRSYLRRKWFWSHEWILIIIIIYWRLWKQKNHMCILNVTKSVIIDRRNNNYFSNGKKGNILKLRIIEIFICSSNVGARTNNSSGLFEIWECSLSTVGDMIFFNNDFNFSAVHM